MTHAPWKPNRPAVASFFFAGAAGLLLIIFLNIFFNEASESAVLLGLSRERLALLGGMLIFSIMLSYLALQILRGKMAAPASQRSINFMIGATLLIFLLAWLITWMPAERFGTFYYYLGRLYPFIVWLTCFSAAGLFLLLAYRDGLDLKQFGAFLREHRVSFMVAGIALLIFGLIALGIVSRVVNMPWYEEDFWYGAGVPLLAWQVLIALAASAVIAFVVKKFFAVKNFEKKYWLDLILFVAIWAIAAFLWAKEPVSPDFFITKPVAPNYELYPDYDAKFFDLFSQYALIGQGLDNGVFYDRPLYSALLAYLHRFAGQDYVQIVAWQAALFAIFPALGYILGQQLYSRPAGAGLAALLLLRGINSIALGPFINTVHQKQMMTDFASAILMMLITVLLIRWLREPGKNWGSLLSAAGVAGLATLLRPHPLIYIPILIALAVWVYRSQKWLWITFSGFILVAALAGILPWVVGNGHGQSVVDLYMQKIKNVIDTRYPDLHLPFGSILPKPIEVAAIDNAHLQLIHTDAEPPAKSFFAFGLDNFLNNLTTTVQVLPYSPYYQDARYTIKTSENFWRPYWDGALSPWGKIILPFNLLLLALGLGAAWRRARWGGLIPLMVMLAYDLMNALARTSGGRYIVPVDWVVIVYYFFGIMALIELVSAFFARPALAAQAIAPQRQAVVLLNRATWLRFSGVLLTFLLIGTLIPLSASPFEQRFPPLTKNQLSQQVFLKTIHQMGVSREAWLKFLSSPQAMLIQGRILYPRQFEKDAGAKVSVYNFYHPQPYPRVLFTLIGPTGETPAMFAAMQAPAIPNASDAIIFGCRESDYIQVWGVLLNDGQLIKRTPASTAKSLTCPLQAPVCDNNHHCK